MNELTRIFSEATAAIKRSYFHLPIDDSDPVYRERVYCYELYHQMRSRWPADCKFYLNGELDKAGHPLLRELGADKSKPDFLVHKPGDMKGNHTIIEVKQVATKKDDIRKDIETLDRFVRKVNYQRAIYLFFGQKYDYGLMEKILSVAGEFDELASIEIWFHNESGESATHNITLQRDATSPLIVTSHIHDT